MSTTLEVDFFTSDMHFNHTKIIQWRERDGDVEEMNNDIIDIWNDTVGPRDTVAILGDVLMGPRLEGLPLLSRLNGNLILLPGNHDHCWRGNRRRITEARNWPELYGQYADIIDDGYYTIPGLPETVYMSHFPFWGDHVEEDRYMQYRPPFDPGTWLIHGHVHSLWRTNGNMINVGLDAWGRPLHTTEVTDLMEAEWTFETCPVPNPLSNRKESP